MNRTQLIELPVVRKRKGAAFTLIELLMVVSIIALLAGMATPILMTAKNSAARNATKATFGKLDAALRLFKTEAGAYP